MSLTVILTPFFEIEAISVNGSYAEKVYPRLMEWLSRSDWTLFFVVLGITTGFLHYWMERAVFRISDKNTRKVVFPLLYTK